MEKGERQFLHLSRNVPRQHLFQKRKNRKKIPNYKTEKTSKEKKKDTREKAEGLTRHRKSPVSADGRGKARGPSPDLRGKKKNGHRLGKGALLLGESLLVSHA